MIDTEAFIRSRAELCWSRQAVADALGISLSKLKTILIALPDVKWAGSGRTCDFKRARQDSRGRVTPALARALALGRQARYANATKFHVGSFVGTTREVYDYWQDHICVSYHTVRRRLQYGMPYLDAFFLPTQISKGWGQNGKFWCHHTQQGTPT